MSALVSITHRLAALEKQDPAGVNARSVKFELQADCLAGVWAHSSYQRSQIESRAARHTSRIDAVFIDAYRGTPAPMGDGIAYELTRVRLGDGQETTVYLVRYPRRSTTVRVHCSSEPRRLDHWCVATGHPEAVVGGFFLRDPYRPLGEVRIDGRPIEHEPIAGGWGPARACVHADGEVRLAARGDLPDAPAGDLLQAGPMLVRDGVVTVDGDDAEGFSRGASQFDSDITAERHPRCALGISEHELLVACCDGRRSRVDAGLFLDELARALVSFGATDAINLDGGGSSTLVHRGHLLNRPYSDYDQPAAESRPVVTALVFTGA